jgi:very-short-patch-repair endonuclease
MPELQRELRDDHGVLLGRPDFVYPKWKLVIEGHSRKWHWGDHASSRDAARHNELTAAGFRILYVTWADVMEAPEATLLRIERALRQCGWVPGAEAA